MFIYTDPCGSIRSHSVNMAIEKFFNIHSNLGVLMSPIPGNGKGEKVGRRKFIAGVGTGIAGVGLAGCTGGGGDAGTTDTTAASDTTTTSTSTTVPPDEVKRGGNLIWAHSEQMIDNDIPHIG